MKKIFLPATLLLSANIFAQTTVTFNYTGAVQTFTVPACVTSLTVDIRGGQGGTGTMNSFNCGGAMAGRVQGALAVTPGDVLYIYVGGQGASSTSPGPGGAGGYNGGGNGGGTGSITYGGGGGGGGGSDIRVSPYALANRVVVAGGGGGGYICPCSAGSGCLAGGVGGGLTGGNGAPPCNACGTPSGGGGTQAAGGAVGAYSACSPTSATAGLFGAGGVGRNTLCGSDNGGGGGGGGWYGGGGGDYGAGGGGSSYTSGAVTGVTHTQGFQSGNGQVIITYSGGSTMTLSGSQADLLCNNICNGTATVTTSGGNTPFTYSWNTTPVQITATATGLCAGNYTVTVTENGGCTATRSYSITQPAALTATTSQVNNPCNGLCIGSATISVSGGTTGYTYNWVPGGGTGSSANNLCAGTYTVTVTDNNGCTLTKTVTITEPSAVGITPSQTNVSCNGGCNGSASLSVTGGASPYTYSWNPNVSTTSSASNLCANSYTVTVQDANGCNKTQLVTITQPQALAVSAASNPNAYCAGGCATVTATPTGGSSPYSYLWAPGNFTGGSVSVCPTASSCYNVTVTDANNCTTTSSVCVTVNPLPNVSMSAQFNTTCVNWTTDQLLGAPSGGTFSGTGVTGNNFNPSVAGTGTFTITYTYTDGNNCTNSATMQIVVDLCTGTAAMGNAGIFEVFPNPFGESMNVVVKETSEISLFNVIGKEIAAKKVPPGAHKIDTSGLPAGVYFIQVRTENGSGMKKIVKE